MIKYFCDRCCKEIKKENGQEILMLHGEYIQPKGKKTRPWIRPVLCEACAKELNEWMDA